MEFTRNQIIEALVGEYEHLKHDCPDDDDMTEQEYRAWLAPLSVDELIQQTDTDDRHMSLATYINAYG